MLNPVPRRYTIVAMTDDLLQTVADHYGTPVYVYDLNAVSSQIHTLKQALPGATLLYAVKANPCGAVLRHMASEGVGAEVITLGELERSVHAGVKPENILLGGPRQDPELIGRALALGVKQVSLDSVSQWQSWQPFLRKDLRFVVRVNPALDPRTHEHLATGAATSKFGVTAAEAKDIANDLNAQNLLSGFHVHAGSQISATSVYDEIFAVLGPLFEMFPDAKHLDIGGGFAVPDFELVTFARKVKAFSAARSLSVTVEPGRYLVATTGVLLTRVLHTKESALNHVIADAGMADLLRPALYSANHPIRKLSSKDRPVSTVDVNGPLCENADRLGRDIKLPAISTGDILVVEQAGAYGLTMSSNYASSLRPAEVAVRNGEHTLARRRETVEDLLRLES